MAVGYGILKMAKLEIEGADRYEVTNLHYTVQELEPFRGKHVLIFGGGDSAVCYSRIEQRQAVHRSLSRQGGLCILPQQPFQGNNRELGVGVDCEYRLNKNQQNIKELPEPLDVVLEVLFYMASTFSSQTLDAIHNIIKWKSSKK